MINSNAMNKKKPANKLGIRKINTLDLGQQRGYGTSESPNFYPMNYQQEMPNSYPTNYGNTSPYPNAYPGSPTKTSLSPSLNIQCN